MDYETWITARTEGIYPDFWPREFDAESIGCGAFVDGPAENPQITGLYGANVATYHDPRVVPVNRRFRASVRARVDWPEFAEQLGVFAIQGYRQTGMHTFCAICPFHDEKTPSFVMMAHGLYRCHGCGSHGDMVDLVVTLKGLRGSTEIRGWFSRFSIMAEPPTAEALLREERWPVVAKRVRPSDAGYDLYRACVKAYVMWRYPLTDPTGPLE